MTTSTGRATETVIFDGNRTVLRVQRRLPRPPDTVWQALTRPEHLAQWFPTRAEIELTPGGRVRYAAVDDLLDAGEGVVTDLDPPRLLAFTWGEDHLRWELTPEGEGTILVLVHTFADRAGAASFAAGWDACLAGLGRVVTGEPVEAPADMDLRHEEFVRRLGLDVSGVRDTPDGPRLRVERQLVRPADDAWPLVRPEAGAGVRITAERRPAELEYEPAGGGRVRWELGEGTGHGARLVLTVGRPRGTDARAALAEARDTVEALAARLAATPRPSG